MRLTRFVGLLVILSIITTPLAQAQQNLSSGLTLSKELAVGGKGNEYVSGDYPGAVLMKVNLWGAVQKPGIHYIPVRTDLVTLLSYAGGPSDRAKFDSVTIKRWAGGKESVIEVDVDDLLTDTGGKPPQLEANDVVVIPSSTPLISNDTMSVIGVAASILSIVVAGFVIQQSLKKK